MLFGQHVQWMPVLRAQAHYLRVYLTQQIGPAANEAHQTTNMDQIDLLLGEPGPLVLDVGRDELTIREVPCTVDQ